MAAVNQLFAQCSSSSDSSSYTILRVSLIKMEQDSSLADTISRRKVWQLNPRLAYLATASLTFTITYTIQQCIFSFEPLRFPTDPQFTYLSDTCLEAWKHKTTTRTAPLLLGCNLAFPVAWVILKGPILRALVYNTILRCGLRAQLIPVPY